MQNPEELPVPPDSGERHTMFNRSNNAEKTWIAENVDCCLSYNAHPMVRYLADECRKETETKEDEE
jgi:hypothetical protein